jgi:YggT family protein
MHPANILGALIQIYTVVIIVRAVFSWLPPENRENEFYRFIFSITEPALRPLRQLLPGSGRIDFSPLVAIVLLQILARALLP